MFWKKFPDVYLSMNDDPVLQIDWYDRHLMDIGVMEETYEYYRAKKIKRNVWRSYDEDKYQYEPDKKIPFKRIEPMLGISLYDRQRMDKGYKEETYEYYRAKKIRDNEAYLNEDQWKQEKIEKKNTEKSQTDSDENIDVILSEKLFRNA